MRIAVISDIHGNLEAFDQVLADMDESSVDASVCLGDSIGYGPDPEKVVQILRKHCIPSVMGNHELAIARPEHLGWFNPSARRSLLITRELISEGTLDYISLLPASLVIEGALFVHGCPPDSMTRYLLDFSERQLAGLFRRMEQDICFVGHTHTLEIVTFDGSRAIRSPLRQGTHSLREGFRYIVNVGSVGQPRDGNNRAKYVLWDNVENRLETRFVPYDARITAAKILELGFPGINATRLL